MAVQKVRRRGRVLWRARVVIDGRQLTAFRERKDEAVEAEAELRARVRDHATEGAPDRPVEVPTLATFVEPFMAHAATENGKAEQHKKKQMLRDHLVPAFGELKLDQISARLIDGYKADKLRMLKPATVANHVSVLKRMLNVAHAWNIIGAPPKVRQVKIPRQDFDFLAFEEAERFIAAAGEWRTFVLVAIRCGLRQGELRGLQWGDVDVEGARVRIARAFTQTGWELPKSGKARTVDLPWDAIEALREHKPARVGRTDLVFPGPSSKPLDEKVIYNACVRIAGAARIGRHVHPHTLRHTFASHHAMRGTPLPVIQAWMGHASITTTMRYSHLCPSTTASFADNAAPTRGPRVVVDNDSRRHRGVTTGVTAKKRASETGS